jgi:3-hydroxyisobutyrate dehydrogenase-like beta-hydroxyacid dehydrogenase
MAANVAGARFPLRVWNRTKAKASGALAAGATWADSPREVGAGCDILITMVSDDDALDAVMFGADGAAAAMRRGSIVVDMSTTRPDRIIATAARLHDHGIRLVDAPVFGSADQAKSGGLWAVVGADERDLADVRGVLDAMCESVRRLGTVGAGSTMKVCGNLIILGMLDLLAEGLTLGVSSGLSVPAMLDALAGIPDIACPLYAGKGAQIADDDYETRFALKHALKDVRLALATGGRFGLPLRATDGVAQTFAAAVQQGHGEEDCMAVIKAVRG